MTVRAADAALGAAAILAFSPGLYDLAAHWIADPWSLYSAVFVLLLAFGAPRHARGATALPRLGAALLAGGLLLQLLAVLAVMPALARPALVLGAIGFLLLRGLASPAWAALALFVVPVPHTFTELLGGEELAPELFRAASRLLHGFGLAIAADRHEVVSGSARLAIDPSQAGLPVAVGMLGLAGYAALRVRPPAVRAARWLPIFFAGGAAAHGAGILLACLALVAGRQGLAAWLVDSFWWLLASGVVVWRLDLRPAIRRAR
jgi:hypothetical protein